MSAEHLLAERTALLTGDIEPEKLVDPRDAQIERLTGQRDALLARLAEHGRAEALLSEQRDAALALAAEAEAKAEARGRALENMRSMSGCRIADSPPDIWYGNLAAAIGVDPDLLLPEEAKLNGQ